MEKPTIRNARSEDIDAILNLFKSLIDLEDDFAFDERKHRTGFLSMMNDPDQCCVQVAEKDGSLVGLCTLQLHYSTAMGGQMGVFENFVVDQQVRGQGIGRLLMEAAENWGAEHQVLRYDLQVDMDNGAAQALYQKNGWIRTNLASYFKYPQ